MLLPAGADRSAALPASRRAARPEQFDQRLADGDRRSGVLSLSHRVPRLPGLRADPPRYAFVPAQCDPAAEQAAGRRALLQCSSASRSSISGGSSLQQTSRRARAHPRRRAARRRVVSRLSRPIVLRHVGVELLARSPAGRRSDRRCGADLAFRRLLLLRPGILGREPGNLFDPAARSSFAARRAGNIFTWAFSSASRRTCRTKAAFTRTSGGSAASGGSSPKPSLAALVPPAARAASRSS